MNTKYQIIGNSLKTEFRLFVVFSILRIRQKQNQQKSPFKVRIKTPGLCRINSKPPKQCKIERIQPETKRTTIDNLDFRILFFLKGIKFVLIYHMNVIT